ncbi:hypothetical protein M8818_002291 [Zalaria obscura]|uniref:Uncharacterized protein n=1 Tax=Zalaria obscura TaxID=2024903 RepID=A0ACC3SHZ4_9PEZI
MTPMRPMMSLKLGCRAILGRLPVWEYHRASVYSAFEHRPFVCSYHIDRFKPLVAQGNHTIRSLLHGSCVTNGLPYATSARRYVEKMTRPALRLFAHDSAALRHAMPRIEAESCFVVLWSSSNAALQRLIRYGFSVRCCNLYRAATSVTIRGLGYTFFLQHNHTLMRLCPTADLPSSVDHHVADHKHSAYVMSLSPANVCVSQIAPTAACVRLHPRSQLPTA